MSLNCICSYCLLSSKIFLVFDFNKIGLPVLAKSIAFLNSVLSVSLSTKIISLYLVPKIPAFNDIQVSVIKSANLSILKSYVWESLLYITTTSSDFLKLLNVLLIPFRVTQNKSFPSPSKSIFPILLHSENIILSFNFQIANIPFFKSIVSKISFSHSPDSNCSPKYSNIDIKKFANLS